MDRVTGGKANAEGTVNGFDSVNASNDLSSAQFPSRCQRLAYSVKETADMLGISEKTVRRLVDRRMLHASRALRHLLIGRREIERFLEETSNNGNGT